MKTLKKEEWEQAGKKQKLPSPLYFYIECPLEGMAYF